MSKTAKRSAKEMKVLIEALAEHFRETVYDDLDRATETVRALPVIDSHSARRHAEALRQLDALAEAYTAALGVARRHVGGPASILRPRDEQCG